MAIAPTSATRIDRRTTTATTAPASRSPSSTRSTSADGMERNRANVFGARRAGAPALPATPSPSSSSSPSSSGGANGYTGRDPGSWPLFHQREIAPNNNACGTTALAMVLAAEGLIPNTNEAAAGVDAAVRMRGLDMGTPGADIVNALHERGMGASLLNQSSFDELESRLAAGNHVMAMVTTGEPHWVNVLGVRHDGDETTLTIADPARGATREMSREEFEAVWQHPFEGNGAFVDGLLGAERTMIAIDRDADNLPAARPGRGRSMDNLLDGATDLAKIPQALGDGRIGDAIEQLLTGTTQLSTSLVGGVGSVVVGAGEQLQDWGDTLRERGGVAGAAGAVVDVAGQGVDLAGQGVRAVGNLGSRVGNGVSSGLRKLFGG